MVDFTLPEKFLKEKFIVYPDQKEKIKKIIEFVLGIDPAWCFYLYGTPGTGKTFVSCFVMQYFLSKSKYHSARFVTPYRYLTGIQNNFKDPIEMGNFMEKLFDTDLLIFDDLGNIPETGWNVSKISELLETRYDKAKKTIITSNLRLTDFKEKTKDDRLYRRLAEGREGEWTNSNKILETVQI